MMTQHFVMTSSLRIKNFKIDKFGDFFRTDIFRDAISLIINQCDLQATEGSFWRTQSVRQPRSASKRSALVYTKRTKVFQHLILSHTNNIKMGLFMKRVTSKRYGIQLIGFQIQIIRIQISYMLIFLINHSFFFVIINLCHFMSHIPPF